MRAKKAMPSEPKSSTPSITDERGQLAIPQNIHTRHIAAAKAGGMPRMLPATMPKVAPTKNAGTISPPLKPAPTVMAVKSILE